MLSLPVSPSPPFFENGAHGTDEPEENGGWCQRCGRMHTLPSALARDDCLALMDLLQRHRRIDWPVADMQADPRCSTDPLFGPAGGKMFGVLSCHDALGTRVVLRAFSGQFNALWQVAGWVAPIFEVAAFNRLTLAPEMEIKRLGREMELLPRGSDEWRQRHAARRDLSRRLMGDIHALYRLVNFRGEEQLLTAAFGGRGAPPSGAGDCCGPKLLHLAAVRGLRPEALAEFYWGRSNGSATKKHGSFYRPCTPKCRMILGFQLCGLL